jgi:hypothetical protein
MSLSESASLMPTSQTFLSVNYFWERELLTEFGVFCDAFSFCAKPNPPPRLFLFPRVLRLRLLHLPNLPLQHSLASGRVNVRAARINSIHAHIQNVPATEPSR